MKTKRIDGELMDKMFRNGLAALISAEKQLNDLNVFPVADGDTGTNMRLTLESGLRYAKPEKEAGAYLKGFSEGALLGARGNSGVILSQIFKGIYTHLARCAAANVGDLRNAFIVSYKTAYSAVVHPAEGTILTVSREGIEHIRNQIDRNTSIEEMLSMYVAEMKKTLSYTPEMLDVLKEAGVVDSGAAGYITIVEGMLRYLYGETLYDSSETAIKPAADAAPSAAPDLSAFNEDTLFEDGYCMEFILQLMRTPGYDQNFRLNIFISELQLCGNSLVAVQDGKRVKVHIHTKHPDKIIAMSQRFGEFLTFKLENMQLQHNEHIRMKQSQPTKKKLSVIAVTGSEKMQKLFVGLGCGNAINGGNAMNVSVEQLVDAAASANAGTVVILPNNKNVLQAALQAEKVIEGTAVRVIPTKTEAEGYFALGMDITDSEDTEYRIKQMALGYRDAVTVSVTAASKPYSSGKFSCDTGDMVAVSDDELLAVGEDSIGALINGLSAVPDIEDRETAVIFRGSGESASREEKLIKILGETYPDIEVNFIDGGSGLYNWIVGLM